MAVPSWIELVIVAAVAAAALLLIWNVNFRRRS
jgi:hypothetical protein